MLWCLEQNSTYQSKKKKKHIWLHCQKAPKLVVYLSSLKCADVVPGGIEFYRFVTEHKNPFVVYNVGNCPNPHLFVATRRTI